jgi:molybdate transport system substrate-binding protein
VRRALLAALALAAGGCGGDDRLVVAAATSLKPALDKHAEAVALTYAGSDEIAARIRRGVRPDVYVAADERLPASLHDEGLVARPVAFATNRLTIAVKRGARIRTLEDLARPGVRIAMGQPGVPVGNYANEVISLLREQREVMANVRSREPDVAGIVGKLTQGAVDAGFIYLTDARAAGLRTVTIPDDLQPRIRYAAAVVTGSDRTAEAQRFIDGLEESAVAAGFGRP